MPEALLAVENLEVHFPVRSGVFQRKSALVRAVGPPGPGPSFRLW